MARARQARATLPPEALNQELSRIAAMSIEGLRSLWLDRYGKDTPASLSKDLLARVLAHQLQTEQLGGLDVATRRMLNAMGKPGTPPTRWLKVGSIIAREYDGTLHEVMVTPQGFCWRGETFTSLSTIALRITGTSWNGARFFGVRGDVKATEGGSPR